MRISYTMNNVVNAWADTGELYWKFVSDGWDVPSDNVTCRVHLPVPAGVTVSGGDNVRAWGHGPLDASLSFDGNDVVYTVPGVGTDEYAEARIAFPVEWLTDMAPRAPRGSRPSGPRSSSGPTRPMPAVSVPAPRFSWGRAWALPAAWTLWRSPRC